MATYNLEQTPDIFISSRHIDNRFCYMMRCFNVHDATSSHVGYIDLAKDKLFIYGTEIKESMLQKLHDVLVTKPSGGKLYVNCNGECYIYVNEARRNYALFDCNVTFDWSTFGVIVPNSAIDVLRKQLREKDEELQGLRSLQSANTTTFEELRQEVEALRTKLENSSEIQEDLKLELHKVCNELSLQNLRNELELESKNFELESWKEEVKELQDQDYASKKENQDMENILHTIQDRLSSYLKEKQETEMELQKVRNELINDHVELQLTKEELESSQSRVAKLEEQFSSCEKKIYGELRKVRKQLSLMINDKLQSMEVMFQFIENKGDDESCVGECEFDALEIVGE